MFLFPVEGSIRLRTVNEKDAKPYFQLYRTRFLAGDPQDALFEDTSFLSHIQSRCELLLVIELPFCPLLFIGDCAIHHWQPKEKLIEFGGTLLPAYQGQGIMQKALSILEKISLARFGIAQVQVSTETKNENAIRFAQKNGFVLLKKTNQNIRFQKFLSL